MNRIITIFVGAVFLGLSSGCATVVTNDADLAKTPNGVRVYPPKVYLMVDTGEKRTTLAFLPDFSRAYDVKPLTIFAKQDFKIEIDEGQLKALTSNQDTTTFLTFMKEAATLAAKASGATVSSTVINGTFGLDSGIYRLNDNGRFEKTK